MAEITNVLDTLICSVKIQRELAEWNAAFPDNHRILSRIGIKPGGLLIERKRTYGGGVRVAAHIESLAEANGICISDAVQDATKSKNGLQHEFLGEHEIENIEEAIRTYPVLFYPVDDVSVVFKTEQPLAVEVAWLF